MTIEIQLTGKIEPFDTFWEAPENIEKGYGSFGQFYKRNYFKYIPKNKNMKMLVISCGPGYFINLAKEEGYKNVFGIDSDPDKIRYAKKRNLNCKTEHAFPFLKKNHSPFDLIFVEQEINHLTKDEILSFLGLCRDNLNNDGILIVHSLNGANPITGSEALAQNFDHFNTLTEYSLKQVLEYAGFKEINIIPLLLYIFYKNPLNYVGLIMDSILNTIFKLSFIFYGKHNRLFSKKIAAVCKK
jgi:SAM-dependent methyltransferase